MTSLSCFLWSTIWRYEPGLGTRLGMTPLCSTCTSNSCFLLAQGACIYIPDIMVTSMSCQMQTSGAYHVS